ncbi:hypothetical protein SUGI_0370530 [Cryptomeria japonica]|uniref:putative UPF0481 protein At3g02645 n=1 Tax=Cryptomeria japonica TaxID=3369 RepID=UPI0024089A39|nr:putative UPF0481 protein At3g02645 [Cryptomeria japonica]GLJ20396.1 hypothetical protein SUGI_0370530 [Cryptomeria japonica]
MAEAASEEQRLISKEWTVEVKNFLKESEQGGTEVKLSMRVPKALINAKPEAYIPQMVSLGPYHHRSLQEEPMGPYHERLSHLSQMDFYKLNSTRDAAQNNQRLTENFLIKVTNMASEFEKFYDWKISDKEEFGRMMMVDAFFLYQFLQNGLHVLKRESSQRQKRYNEIFTPTLTSIRCDILKLENQIPLSLLKEIDSTLNNNKLQECLNSSIPHLSCFQVSHNPLSHNPTLEYKDEYHLLGCMHKYVSSLLQIHDPAEDKPGNLTCRESFMTAMGDMVAAIFAVFFPHPAKQGRDDFLDKYNAKELVKAGIQFKPGWNKIRFDKQSDTLFLPKIVISDTYTEAMMRNLLALEFNDANRPKHVIQYVELMDCLIDTPEDVTLLRKCEVIDRHSMMITDEHIAKMWDGMAKPLFFAGFLEHAQGLKAGIRETLIKNFYKSKIRNTWAEFHGEHLSRPWKALALLTAILVVGLTAIQAYCSLADCAKKSQR